MERIIAVAGLLVGVLGAAGAIGAWLAARRAAGLGARNIELTASLVETDQDRRHEQLTPQFKVTCEQTSEDRAKLRIELIGPDGLDRLDEVVVIVRNDTHTRGESQIASGPSAEEIARFVWSPYRLVPKVDRADETGRRVSVEKLFRGDWIPLALERTSSPHWVSDPSRWRREWSSKPLRLLFICRQGNASWEVPHELDIIPMPATATVRASTKP